MIPAGSDNEVQVEALLLVRMGADIFYIARPRQNAFPTGFRMVSQSDTEATFENATHDFPQRITYRRTSDDAFTATIAGPDDDGETQEIDFHFTRRAFAVDSGHGVAQEHLDGGWGRQDRERRSATARESHRGGSIR